MFFFKIQFFRSLKCPLHIASYAPRIRVSVMELYSSEFLISHTFERKHYISIVRTPFRRNDLIRDMHNIIQSMTSCITNDTFNLLMATRVLKACASIEYIHSVCQLTVTLIPESSSLNSCLTISVKVVIACLVKE